MKKLFKLNKEIESVTKQVTKQYSKLEILVIKHDELVSIEFSLEEQKTDLEYENKNTSKIDTKIYNILNKCYENTDKQKEINRLIKNLKLKKTRLIKKLDLCN